MTRAHGLATLRLAHRPRQARKAMTSKNSELLQARLTGMLEDAAAHRAEMKKIAAVNAKIAAESHFYMRTLQWIILVAAVVAGTAFVIAMIRVIVRLLS